MSLNNEPSLEPPLISVKQSFLNQRHVRIPTIVGIGAADASLSNHARALEGVAKRQFPLKAVVFKSRYRVLTCFPYTWTPSCTLAWNG